MVITPERTQTHTHTTHPMTFAGTLRLKSITKDRRSTLPEMHIRTCVHTYTHPHTAFTVVQTHTQICNNFINSNTGGPRCSAVRQPPASTLVSGAQCWDHVAIVRAADP